jgi:hypothetical protein
MSTGCLSESTATATAIPDPTTSTTTVAACPNNQHLNDQRNCIPDKVTTTTICSTGSKPNDNEKCPADVNNDNNDNNNPTSTTTVTCPSGQHLNNLSKCIPDKKCPDGSIPIKDKKCPPLLQQPKQPQQPSVGDCKLHPDELSCPQPKKPTQPNHPDDDCLFKPNLNKCNPDQNGNCPSGFSLNGREQCIPDKACPSGFTRHNDDETRTCYPVIKEQQQQQTPPQSQPQQQPTTAVVVIKQPVIVKTRVETTVKNFITKNIFSSSGTTITANNGTFTTQQQHHNQPTSLLLLDSAQICQLAGDLQCVSQQNLFKTLNLVTYPDSSGKYWIITGQAENVDILRKALTNVQLVAHFYDSKGNNIGGLQQVDVTPGTLKPLQTGVFNIKANTFSMNGTPAFMRLEFLSSYS